MRFLACSVAFLLIVAGVAVLSGCIPITKREGDEAYTRRADALKEALAGERDVRAAFGEPVVTQLKGGARRLEYQVPISKRTVYLTLCGVLPTEGLTNELHRLSVDMDAGGRVRSYRLE
jgi:hypothetical protein